MFFDLFILLRTDKRAASPKAEESPQPRQLQHAMPRQHIVGMPPVHRPVMLAASQPSNGGNMAADGHQQGRTHAPVVLAHPSLINNQQAQPYFYPAGAVHMMPSPQQYGMPPNAVPTAGGGVFNAVQPSTGISPCASAAPGAAATPGFQQPAVLAAANSGQAPQMAPVSDNSPVGTQVSPNSDTVHGGFMAGSMARGPVPSAMVAASNRAVQGPISHVLPIHYQSPPQLSPVRPTQHPVMYYMPLAPGQAQPMPQAQPMAQAQPMPRYPVDVMTNSQQPMQVMPAGQHVPTPAAQVPNGYQPMPAPQSETGPQ